MALIFSYRNKLVANHPMQLTDVKSIQQDEKSIIVHCAEQYEMKFRICKNELQYRNW
jgi:hypothetical protein